MTDPLLVPYEKSAGIVRDNVCRACHGKLYRTFGPDRDTDKILCADCGEGCPGWVSKETVESIERQQRQEAQEVMDNYPQFFPQRERKEARDIINDLGFGG